MRDCRTWRHILVNAANVVWPVSPGCSAHLRSNYDSESNILLRKYKHVIPTLSSTLRTAEARTRYAALIGGESTAAF
jgi:hypothetical protein